MIRYEGKPLANESDWPQGALGNVCSASVDVFPDGSCIHVLQTLGSLVAKQLCLLRISTVEGLRMLGR